MKINYFAKFFGLIYGGGWGIELLDYYLNIWENLQKAVDIEN